MSSPAHWCFGHTRVLTGATIRCCRGPAARRGLVSSGELGTMSTSPMPDRLIPQDGPKGRYAFTHKQRSHAPDPRGPCCRPCSRLSPGRSRSWIPPSSLCCSHRSASSTIGRGQELENGHVALGEATIGGGRRWMGQQATCADGSDSHRGTLEQERTTVRQAPGTVRMSSTIVLSFRNCGEQRVAWLASMTTQRCGRSGSATTALSDCLIGRADHRQPARRQCAARWRGCGPRHRSSSPIA